MAIEENTETLLSHTGSEIASGASQPRHFPHHAYPWQKSKHQNGVTNMRLCATGFGGGDCPVIKLFVCSIVAVKLC